MPSGGDEGLDGISGNKNFIFEERGTYLENICLAVGEQTLLKITNESYDKSMILLQDQQNSKFKSLYYSSCYTRKIWW